MIKRQFLAASIIIISILILWQNIILHINTNLRGWYDELFIIWIYQNNIQRFISPDINSLYETNAMYPFQYTLSFAEHMYFPSFLILIISLLAKNPIAQYNLLLVANHLLIFIASLLFFRKILKDNLAGLISAAYTTFSPYFFVKIGHFQMLFFWPMFFSLYFLVDYFETKRKKSFTLAAVFAGLQFLSSVYLGIMNLTIVLIWFLAARIYSKQKLVLVTKRVAVFLFIFLLTSSISLYGYLLVNTKYQAKRDYGEYVTYSASLTDYIFPVEWQDSFVYSSLPFKKFQNFNHHEIGESAAFVGLVPLLLAVFFLFPKIRKIKEEINISFNFSTLALFSLLLILAGFILSLGPRLFVNGQYTELPLPSDLLLKIFPPIGIIRVVARWHFLVILGTSILLGLGYIKLQTRICKSSELRKTLLLTIVLLGIFLEFYPLKPIFAYPQTWGGDSYNFLKDNVCKNSNTVLLEYPFHYRNIDADVGKDVNYMAKILLDSTQHKCKILSGYYSYEPPAYLQIKQEFENGFDDKDINLIKDLGIDYIKFNKFAISDQEFMKIEQAKTLENFRKIYDKNKVIILQVTDTKSNTADN